MRVGEHLGEFVSANVAESGEPLGVRGEVVFRIATGIAIEFEEEGELNGDVAAGTGAMPCAESGVSAGRVDVDGIVTVGFGIGDHGADFGEDGRGLVAHLWRRAGINVSGAECDGGTDVTDPIEELGVGSGVIRSADADIKGLDAGDLVTGVRPVSPEDGFDDRAVLDGASVVDEVR